MFISTDSHSLLLLFNIYLVQGPTRLASFLMIMLQMNPLQALLAFLASTLYLLFSFRLFLVTMVVTGWWLFFNCHPRIARLHDSRLHLIFRPHMSSRPSTRVNIGWILVIFSGSLVALRTSLNLIGYAARTIAYHVHRWSSERKDDVYCIMLMLAIGVALIINAESWLVISGYTQR